MSKKSRRQQSVGEEIGNSVTHGIAFILGVIATVMMIIKADTQLEYIGCSIFGFGIMILYLMSCLYHSFKLGTTVKQVFKRFDHLSIYLLIGGTFAPLLLCAVRQPLGYVFFAVQWLLIIIGVILKSISPSKHHKMHVALYLLIGWSGLFLMSDLILIDMSLCLLILFGGIVYSLGVVFYASNFKYAHFAWHFFCIGGTLLHFLGVYLYVL